MQTTTKTREELAADAKLVYNGSLNDLVALADKYGVTTRSLDFACQHPDPIFASFAIQAFPTKGHQTEIRKKLYATIKGQMR